MYRVPKSYNISIGVRLSGINGDKLSGINHTIFGNAITNGVNSTNAQTFLVLVKGQGM